jgi:hypothetical protein
VDAVLMFQNPANAAGAQQQSELLKEQLTNLSTEEPIEANYFPNLGSVAVRAKARVLRKLLKHPGLSVAALNRP